MSLHYKSTYRAQHVAMISPACINNMDIERVMIIIIIKASYLQAIDHALRKEKKVRLNEQGKKKSDATTKCNYQQSNVTHKNTCVIITKEEQHL